MGATGFLGAGVAAGLRSHGHEVRTPARTPVDGVALDISDVASCRAALAAIEPDAVVNAAGAGVTAGSATADGMVAVNVVGATNLADACATCDQPVHLVHLASSTEPLAGALPESEYSETKARGTQAVRDVASRTGAAASIVRVHNVYGLGQPAGRFVGDLVEAARTGGAYEIHHPDRVRDFCLLDDVVGHVVAITEAMPVGEFEIGTGTGTALREVAHMVHDIYGDKAPSLVTFGEDAADPAAACVAGDGPGSLLVCPTDLRAGLEQMARELVA